MQKFYLKKILASSLFVIILASMLPVSQAATAFELTDDKTEIAILEASGDKKYDVTVTITMTHSESSDTFSITPKLEVVYTKGDSDNSYEITDSVSNLDESYTFEEEDVSAVHIRVHYLDIDEEDKLIQGEYEIESTEIEEPEESNLWIYIIIAGTILFIPLVFFMNKKARESRDEEYRRAARIMKEEMDKE